MHHLKPGPWGVWLCALLVLSACARSPAPDPSAVAAAGSIPSLENCALPQDSVRYIVVLDHSGSMKPDWPTVRRQLPAILDAIKEDGGRLHLELFSGHIVTPIHNTLIDASSRADLRGQLANVPEPEQGAYTDIGLALASAADAIVAGRKDGFGRVTLLFVITDGENKPPPGAIFNLPDSIEALRQRWETLASETRTKLYIFTVPIGSAGLSGADWVAGLIPQTIRIPPTPAARLGEIIAYELAKANKDMKQFLAAQDAGIELGDSVSDGPLRLSARLSQPVQPMGFFGSTPAEVVVHSDAACVTYRLTQFGSTEHELPFPDSSASLILPISPRLGWRQRLPWDSAVTDTFAAAHVTPRLGDLFLDSVVVDTSARVGNNQSPSLQASVELEPSGELRALGINPTSRAISIPVSGVVEYRPMGWWVVWVPGGGVAVMILLGMAFWIWIRLPPKTGSFQPQLRAGPVTIKGDPREWHALPLFPADSPYKDSQRVEVRFLRHPRHVPPKRATMEVRVIDSTTKGAHSRPAAIAAPNGNGNKYDVKLLERQENGFPAKSEVFILWPTKNEEKLEDKEQLKNKRKLTSSNAKLYPGYRWRPPSSR